MLRLRAVDGDVPRCCTAAGEAAAAAPGVEPAPGGGRANLWVGVIFSTVCGTAETTALCPLTGSRRGSCQIPTRDRLVHLLGRSESVLHGLEAHCAN